MSVISFSLTVSRSQLGQLLPHICCPCLSCSCHQVCSATRLRSPPVYAAPSTCAPSGTYAAPPRLSGAVAYAAPRQSCKDIRQAPPLPICNTHSGCLPVLLHSPPSCSRNSFSPFDSDCLYARLSVCLTPLLPPSLAEWFCALLEPSSPEPRSLERLLLPMLTRLHCLFCVV